jgi:hypothetical protein
VSVGLFCLYTRSLLPIYYIIFFCIPQPHGMSRLRVLMRTLCLRRGKDLIKNTLPKRTIQVHKVALQGRNSQKFEKCSTQCLLYSECTRALALTVENVCKARKRSRMMPSFTPRLSALCLCWHLEGSLCLNTTRRSSSASYACGRCATPHASEGLSCLYTRSPLKVHPTPAAGVRLYAPRAA